MRRFFCTSVAEHFLLSAVVSTVDSRSLRAKENINKRNQVVQIGEIETAVYVT